jgi:topoisomerase IA-like protein
MSDLDLNTQEAFDRLEDIDETWALKLMDECEQQMHSTYIDDQEIHVELTEDATYESIISQAEQIFLQANENSTETKSDTATTAIERQISLKAEQAKAESSNAEKTVQGFWSFLRRNKAIS